MDSTYPLRVAVQRTGLSAERLRAWESRYGAVRPVRTPGGSRRYRESDLERLRLLRLVVDAGERIGDVARLDEAALRARLGATGAVGSSGVGPGLDARPGARAGESRAGAGVQDDPFAALWAPLARLEEAEIRARLEVERDARGDAAFAREFVPPFLVEVGERWAAGALTVAAEHLASQVLTGLLGAAVEARRPRSPQGSIVFATPSGERHALGLLLAALVAADAGADPILLGADVPEDDLVESVLRSRASVLALGVVTLASREAEGVLRRLRARLPARIAVWVGGPGAPRCAPIPGVVRIANLGQLASELVWRAPVRDRQAS